MILNGLLLILLILIIACSSSKMSNSSVSMSISLIDSIAGKEAIAKNDCYTCHKFKDKLVGPSFLSVSNKYDQTDNNIMKLAKKIQEGGKGSWGRLPMLPHSSLSTDEAQQMVKYIFSLKK